MSTHQGRFLEMTIQRCDDWFFTDDTGFFSPVVLEAGPVVAVEDVPPAVDIHYASGQSDEQHQCELDHVTDLNQHGGSHQCQHSDVAVIFGVFQATMRARPRGGEGRGGGSHSAA